ncbi:MAG TPA: chemotaxis protein CheW [Acetobacteraceae bacterium]|nr:chemotaxis protein CheW [Acetobacteraceae bacterium]
MDDLLAEFLTETNESLAELDVALLKLERTPDDQETLSQIFRLVHTIKGTCGFLGLPRLERVAHAGESVLGRVRDGVLIVTPDIVSLILRALDRIKAIVTGLGTTGTEPQGDDAPLIAALDEVAERPAGPPMELAPTPALPQSHEPAPTGRSEEAPPPAAEPVAQTIRVAVDVLEDLMTLVSELVLTRNQLLQLARTQEDSAFTVPLQRLSQITSDLQEGVMKTRMQPIGNAWNKLPRLVRDLARDLDKKIELTMHGQETELDRQVLELIKDPLTHMVRNSGDHGLELPAERRAAGKPEIGRISLKAYHEGGHIIIEIADDGRGLAVERIRAKAIGNGLATEAELAGMSEGQVQRFIFRAGFSTAAQVTAVSGRGVGMDVVKTNIERIGGTIDLKSVAGAGSTFTIKIPLTLAIVSALIVEASGERFAIPQLSVVELVRAGGGSGAAIERINATPVLRLRDRLLPLVNLNELLRLRPPAETVEPADAYIVVAQVGATMLGIMVDQVFDTEEIVVKPVAPILRHITMFSGNTILGDGSVIMILDPNGIARATAIGGGEHRAALTAATGAHRTEDHTAILIFRAGGQQPFAVPLGLVARLENISRERIEASAGGLVTQYRGKLMPLVPVSGSVDEQRERHPVLVFADGERSMGLLVDEIVDVVEERLGIELSAARPGLLGSAVVAGHATDVIDTAYWLSQAWRDWFGGRPDAAARRRVLLVDDSDFLRQLLVPWLSAAGYQVTATASAAAALKLRDAGVAFDAIVSDIEMPDMDGLAFARAVRGDGPWRDLPMLALSAREDARNTEAAHAAGFSGFVGKSDRDALTAALRRCVAVPAET